MERIPFQVVTRTWVRAGLAALLGLAVGCVGLDTFLVHTDDRPTGVVCQVVTTWQNTVMFSPDQVHGGTPVPGITGRLYLFGPEISTPLVGDGGVMVDLYDDAPKAQGGQPVMLEEWRLDADTLKKLLRRDPIGWGYTLFLPWGTYRPEIRQVHLVLRYNPAKGTPIFSSESPLLLVHDPATEPSAAHRPPTPAPSQAARTMPPVMQSAATTGAGFAAAR
jgi:hypothetical protein